MRGKTSWIALLAVGILLPGCGYEPARPPGKAPAAASGPAGNVPAAGPGTVAPAADYAQARSTFKTRLVRRGPSPQQGEPLRTPPRAVEVRYRSGGLTLVAYVDPPPAGGARRPAVLFLHGGFAFGDDDWQMPQPFRDAGYVVMVPVLRGENGQPGSFTLYYDEVDDALAAAEALAGLAYVDANRIYLAGHSAGGALAMLTACASSRFKAAASLSGSPDLSPATLESVLAVFDRSDPREKQLRSPLSFAASFKCPVRLFYGAEELWAPGVSEETARRARAGGLDVQAESVPGDHFSSVPAAIAKSIEFFRQR
jgi:dipeptidyl aminopeptidase/acylaminoacyl peptidase